MLKKQFTKDMVSKLIVGTFALVLYLELVYQFGLAITAMFLGDYFKAQSAVNSHSYIYKIILTLLSGCIFAVFFVISNIFYRFGLMIFGKHD